MTVDRTIAVLFASLAVVLSLSAAGVARAETPRTATATIFVRVTVLPFSEVTLEQSRAVLAIPAGEMQGPPVYVGGTVRTNVAAKLLVQITPPAGAAGTTWKATPEVEQIATAGVHHFDPLLRIEVQRTGTASSFTENYELDLLTGSAGTPPSSAPGAVTVLIVPQ